MMTGAQARLLLLLVVAACAASAQAQDGPPLALVADADTPFVSGMRLETEEAVDFVGYTREGVSVVRAAARARVLLFGRRLDRLAAAGFTTSGSCADAARRLDAADFHIQTERRVLFDYDFPAAARFRLCVQSAAPGPRTPMLLWTDPHTSVTTVQPERHYHFPWGVQVALIVGCLVLSALFSGLNLGLMSLTPQELTLISKSGSAQERWCAERVLPVRQCGNRLLCSLLIGNVCVNSAISILVDDFTTGYVALIVSSAGIVWFGEIAPQAVCVKKGLQIGARTIWVTRFFMALTWPLSYPIARVLDLCFGAEVVSFDRKRLMEMIKLGTTEHGLAEELKIAVGAMEIADKTVKDVMTKIDDVFMLADSTVLNARTVAEILRMGYTRVPVYAGSRERVVALLFVKDLALLDPDDNFTIRTVCAYHEHVLRFVHDDTPLRAILEEFKRGEYHLAMVQRTVRLDNGQLAPELVGVVTLEDILEEILQAEIVDETDAITDNVNKTRRKKTVVHDYNRWLAGADAEACLISMHMQLVTLQWLTTNHPLFYERFVSRVVLEKVVRQNVHKLELAAATAAHGAPAFQPAHARLFEKRLPADRFVLILEGRANVTIGDTDMTFEAGPWQCFGREVLDELQRLLAAGGGARADAPDPKKAVFTPDFTLTVADHCTYLTITPRTYLLAWRATRLNRAGAAEAAAADAWPCAAIQKTVSEGVLLGAGPNGVRRAAERSGNAPAAARKEDPVAGKAAPLAGPDSGPPTERGGAADSARRATSRSGADELTRQTGLVRGEADQRTEPGEPHTPSPADDPKRTAESVPDQAAADGQSNPADLQTSKHQSTGPLDQPERASEVTDQPTSPMNNMHQSSGPVESERLNGTANAIDEDTANEKRAERNGLCAESTIKPGIRKPDHK